MAVTLVTQDDINYFAQQSTGKLNLIVSGMTALINDNEAKTEALANQGWFQRMINSITGKNRATRDEIRQNHDKINLYVTQAISELIKQNMIDRQIMMSLGNQLNEIYAEHVQLKQQVGMFVSKLNAKIESVDNFHLLTTELEQGVYSNNAPLIAICKVMAMMDNRSIKDERKRNIIERSLVNCGILTGKEYPLSEYIMSIMDVPVENIASIYTEMNTLKENFISQLITATVEGYHLLPDMVRRMKKKESIAENILSQFQLDADVTLNINELYSELMNDKVDMVRSLQPIEKIAEECNIDEAENLFSNLRFEEAYQAFSKLAMQGNGKAMYYMAAYYLDGYKPVKVNYTIANDWKRKAAATGYPASIMDSVYLPENEDKKDEIIAECKQSILNLIELDDKPAIIEYASILDRDDPKRKELYLRLSDLGDWRGTPRIGNDEWNRGNYEEAAKWYRKGVNIGELFSQYHLANLMENNYISDTDPVKIFDLYKKAADNGNGWAANYVGNCYYNGNGTVKNYEEAVKYYLMSAEHETNIQGAVFNNIGECYYYGHGVVQDYKKALEYYQKGASKGHTVAKSNIAACYRWGYGVDVDYNEARKWYEMAAKEGNCYSMNSLGYMYANGEGVPVDYNATYSWFKAAEENGSIDGTFNLGYYYHHYSQNDDKDRCIEYYEKAGNNGIYKAWYQLGEYYRRELGDGKKAIDPYTKAAQAGIMDAQEQLGELYYVGSFYSIEENRTLARKWYNKAADQGSRLARKRLDNMDAEDRERSRKVDEDLKRAIDEMNEAYDNIDSPWKRLKNNLFG